MAHLQSRRGHLVGRNGHLTTNCCGCGAGSTSSGNCFGCADPSYHFLISISGPTFSGDAELGACCLNPETGITDKLVAEDFSGTWCLSYNTSPSLSCVWDYSDTSCDHFHDDTFFPAVGVHCDSAPDETDCGFYMYLDHGFDTDHGVERNYLGIAPRGHGYSLLFVSDETVDTSFCATWSATATVTWTCWKWNPGTASYEYKTGTLTAAATISYVPTC